VRNGGGAYRRCQIEEVLERPSLTQLQLLTLPPRARARPPSHVLVHLKAISGITMPSARKPLIAHFAPGQITAPPVALLHPGRYVVLGLVAESAGAHQGR
jgi:hypothetical protein